MLNSSFQRYLEQVLTKKFRQKMHVRRILPVSGGSINSVCRIDTTNGTFFLKSNDPFQYPEMFRKEESGLKVLRDTKTIYIPEVILQDEFEDMSFLLMEFVGERSMKENFWQQFGTQLAALHKHSDKVFGFTEDNYIGSLVQSNRQHNNWIDFFITERIEFQLARAVRNSLLNTTDVKYINELFKKLDDIFPKEVPALLHGDLWSGNYLVNSKGDPCVVDPAVYYGHREMDLAMTYLFGGFEQPFYDSYESAYPLQPGFDERMEIYNLYPLLVHVNLFGGDYVNDVRGVVKAFA